MLTEPADPAGRAFRPGRFGIPAQHMNRRYRRLIAMRLTAVAASLLMIGVGTWATAPIAARQRRATESIDDFQLPPKTVFDKTMPRYPNVWFHVDTALARSHRE